MNDLPIINVNGLAYGSSEEITIGNAIGEACIQHGFFYISGHGVNSDLLRQLEEYSRQFFDLNHKEKMRIHMSKGGSAWRGYFPVGEELTSGKPDIKEGVYFGQELDDDDARVRLQIPFHGSNLFPESIPGFKEVVLEYMDALTDLGHRLMRGISLSLGLDGNHFNSLYTADPFVLFRIFHYPAIKSTGTTADNWGVGEHTDYGVLTILKQDDNGGLQVRSDDRWIDAPPVPGTFVCNIGDMLDRMTGGLYRSTPHRVRNVSGKNRMSWPFFFDPGFNRNIRPLELPFAHTIADDRIDRWDKESVHDFDGTYGEYLTRKVSKVFPDLSKRVQ